MSYKKAFLNQLYCRMASCKHTKHIKLTMIFLLYSVAHTGAAPSNPVIIIPVASQWRTVPSTPRCSMNVHWINEYQGPSYIIFSHMLQVLKVCLINDFHLNSNEFAFSDQYNFGLVNSDFLWCLILTEFHLQRMKANILVLQYCLLLVSSFNDMCMIHSTYHKTNFREI